jgi:hypothetical protein
MSHTYALPVFPRGTGLGNRLFHWCDAKVYSYQTGSLFISPRWCRVSLGRHFRSLAGGQLTSEPFIEYTNTFRRLPSDISYPKGVAYSLLCSKVFLSKNPGILTKQITSKTMICFDKSEYRFDMLNTYRYILIKDLLASIQQNLYNKTLKSDEPYIGIHVRIGDGFKPPEPNSDGFVRTGWLQQTPIQWFKETLCFIRKVTGINYRAFVFSDGNKVQLEPLLDVDNTFLFQSNHPVVDLLSLSRSWLILGSGSSSFSAFAAYLGTSHAITSPGHPFTNRGLFPCGHQAIGSLNPRDAQAEVWIKSLAKPDSSAFN